MATMISRLPGLVCYYKYSHFNIIKLTHHVAKLRSDCRYLKYKHQHKAEFLDGFGGHSYNQPDKVADL